MIQMATNLALLVLISLQPVVDCLHILAIFPLNSHSHSAMCIRLAKGLADHGHELDVYSHYPLKNPPVNYRDHSLAGSLPVYTNNMTYEMAMPSNTPLSPGSMKDAFDLSVRPVCDLMKLPVFKDLLEKNLKNGPYDLVIVEPFLTECYLAWGRHFNIPVVAVMTTSFLMDLFNDALGNPFNTAVTPGSRVDFLHPMNFRQRLENTINSSVFCIVIRYLLSQQDAYVDRIFGPGYPTVSELEKDMDLVIINSHFSLEGPRAYVPAIVPVAGLHISDDDAKLPEDLQKWLDDSTAGCIFCSFGSMILIETFPKQILKSFYDSFKAIAPVRVLWKIARPELLPHGLPSNVMTQKWFPQNQVLKHKNTKVFVTHGGLMSSLEAIQFGVPMVGIPVFADQHQNVDVNVRMGISAKVILSELTQEKLTDEITRIIQNPNYRKKSKKLKDLFVDRPMPPLDTAVYWVEYIGRHGKNALRSPLVDMPWYQKNLLDVYGFIGLTIYAVYYAMKVLVKKVFVLSKKDKKDKYNLGTTKVSAKKEN